MSLLRVAPSQVRDGSVPAQLPGPTSLNQLRPVSAQSPSMPSNIGLRIKKSFKNLRSKTSSQSL